jgi:hypothetical protein
MKNDTVLTAIKSLLPNQLHSYLSAQNWVEDGSIGTIATIWHRNESEYHDYEIVQPKTTDLKDYHQRVYDLVNILADFEGRSLGDLADDLSHFHADVIKIRVVHDDVGDGSIPINDGVLLFDKARELLTSVVKATFTKRSYFGGGGVSAEITEYLDTLRFGQTEVGSYVVNLIAPVEQLSPDHIDQLDVSLTRHVTSTLANSLTAIGESIDQYKKTGSKQCFDTAVPKGASANLCDALIGLSGESKQRNVNISITLSKADNHNQDLPLVHRFSSDLVPYLQEASEYYRGSYDEAGYMVTGIVTSLKHEENDVVGTVMVQSIVNGMLKSVSFELPMIEYWEAHQAHKQHYTVECVGDLHVTPRSAKLLNAKEFRVFGGTKDMFDN